MATHDDSRVTKDTSARKNTRPAIMHSALEMAAVKASHESYVSTIVTGYESRIESLEAAHTEQVAGYEGTLQNLNTKHAEELARLKNEHSGAITKTEALHSNWKLGENERQHAAISEAIRRAAVVTLKETGDLRKRIASLVNEQNDLKVSLNEALTKNKDDASSAAQKTTELEASITTLEEQHARQIRALWRKAAITVTFVRKGCKSHAILISVNTRFNDALEQLNKNCTNNKVVASWSCYHNKTKIVGWNKTLLELGLKNDAIITCMRE